MITYRDENLDRLVEQLRRANAPFSDRIEDSKYGRFAWD